MYLLRDLPEIVDEADDGILLEWVVDVVDVDVAFVEEMMENVDGVHGSGASLFVAEYEVDPFVQVGAHVVAF